MSWTSCIPLLSVSVTVIEHLLDGRRCGFLMQKLEEVGKRLFFLETDLKGGTHATLDNTGKSILAILRHLGKISEVLAMQTLSANPHS